MFELFDGLFGNGEVGSGGRNDVERIARGDEGGGIGETLDAKLGYGFFGIRIVRVYEANHLKSGYLFQQAKMNAPQVPYAK
jgi:hypothetical protein